jgi:hypothetical protein
MRSSLRITGLREARDRVDDVGDRARRPEPVLRSSQVRLTLQESARRRFTRYRFKPASPEWVARKRREGLDPRTMRATNRLSSALINAESGTVRLTVFNGVLTWGLRTGATPTYYAVVQAKRGRRAVVIDRPARKEITERVEGFVAYGFLGGGTVG